MFNLHLHYLRINLTEIVHSSIVSGVLGAFLCPESPRWLISVGRDDDAMAIMRSAAATNGLNPEDVFRPGVRLKDEHTDKSKFQDLIRCVLGR
jgi:hypothetical protein